MDHTNTPYFSEYKMHSYFKDRYEKGKKLLLYLKDYY